MGQKAHPTGIRLGINQKSCSYWYANNNDYSFFILEDKYIRDYVNRTYRHCIISEVQIERRGTRVRIRISGAQISILVGPNGVALRKLRSQLEHSCKRIRRQHLKQFYPRSFTFTTDENSIVQIFVQQIKHAELHSQCLADFIVNELEKRVAFRRVLRTAQELVQNFSTIRGLRLQISGRLNGRAIARTEWVRKGRVPLHTFAANLDYSSRTASTIYGRLGVKVWIFQSLTVYKNTTLN